MHLRKTKIVATVGPSSCSHEMLTRLIESGVDVFRLNFSHGTSESHLKHAQIIREISRAANKSVGILCDLQGPKIRIGKFAEGQIKLKEGDSFTLDSKCELGDQTRVGLDYKNLPNEVKAGTILLLDDGCISLHVDLVESNQIVCSVITGGSLSDNKGINLQGGGLAAASLTLKDEEDIKTAVALCADFVAVSFPKDANDIQRARELIRQAGGYAHVVAKIERAEAIASLEEIIDVSDVVMVARGDLGVEVGDASVPGLQKKIIKIARAKNKVVITATQMMQSMVSNPIPTRAEVSDVANAVLDGTDAVMLSAETAVGIYPLETILAVHRVCLEAEHEQELETFPSFEEKPFKNIDESIAMAASYIANHLPIKAVASLTQSGASVLWISRVNNHVPVYALSTESKTRRRLKLYRGVYPFSLGTNSNNKEEVLSSAKKTLLDNGLISHDDMVLITVGEPIGVAGSTNSLQIIKVN